MGGVTASIRFLGGLPFFGAGVLPGIGGGLMKGLGVSVTGPGVGTLTGLVVTLTFFASQAVAFSC